MALKDDIAEALIGQGACIRCDYCDRVIVVSHDDDQEPWWQVCTTDADGDIDHLFYCCSESCANEMHSSERFIIPPSGHRDESDED